MIHDLLEVLRVHGIQDIEEKLPRRPLIFGKVIRKKSNELFVLREGRPEIFHGQLVIFWDFDVVDVLLLE